MSVLAATWLIVLFFACATLSAAAVMRLRRRQEKIEMHERADRFAVEDHGAEVRCTDIRFVPSQPKIETSFDDERIGKL
jgi:hypothetical protein